MATFSVKDFKGNGPMGGTIYVIEDCGGCQTWEVIDDIDGLCCGGNDRAVSICMRCKIIPFLPLCWKVPAYRLYCCENEDSIVFCGLNSVPTVNIAVIGKEANGKPKVCIVNCGQKCELKCVDETTDEAPETQDMER